MIKDYIDPDCITNPAFYDSIREIVVCNICTGILLNPRECSLCQNSFCKKCLDEWTCINSSCPYKCEKSEFRESSRTLKNLLEKLLFHCNSCNSTEKEQTYALFLKHVKSCEKIKVNCPTCDSLVNKKTLNENKFYLKLKESYNNLLEKFKSSKEENQKLKEEIKFIKENQQHQLPSDSPMKSFINSNFQNVNLNRRNSTGSNLNNFISNLSNNSNINNFPINNNSNNNNSNFPINNNNNSNNLNSEIGIIDKCEHFKGNYMPIFSCCEKSFPCFMCHDEVKDHQYKISNKVVCLICKNIYSGPKCNVCNSYQVYRKK